MIVSSWRTGGRTPDDPRRRAREVRRLSTINDDGREVKSRVEFPLKGRLLRVLFRGDSVMELLERILGRLMLEVRLSAAMNAALERNWRKSSASSHMSPSVSIGEVDSFDPVGMDGDFGRVDRGGCGAGRGLSKTGLGPNSGISFFPA